MDFPGWDPVLLDIPLLPIDVRWYGLMYVVGFICAQWILTRLARRQFFPVPPEAAGDLVFYCVFGVLLGGRTGYALFYDHSLLNPLQFVQVWRGGLAFHGGLGGVAIAAWLFCRKYKIGWGRTADALALAVTPGIFAVRVANFINGELFGRVTEKGVGWAMQFPTDPMAMKLMGLSDAWTMRDRELCLQVAYGKRTWESVQGLLSEVDQFGGKIDWAEIAPRLDWAKVKAMTDAAGHPLVPFRHPSQLYEGLGEGLLLGLVLLTLYLVTRKRPLRAGNYTAVFLLGYAAARISLENVRQPDAIFGPVGTVFLGMTMGQTLSVGMVVGAVLILVWPYLRRGSRSRGGE
ncbi:MAG: prolipoprotein diacylglyceryl transferase [Planctomycetes bacterium]|nr:prolipoprotein diacylglyceryl transferase [Planctomycetota bacterium]MCB9887145.1 prolipoprotein diacylglyceryl transferase [Planctomycetota bacterium]